MCFFSDNLFTEVQVILGVYRIKDRKKRAKGLFCGLHF